MVESNPGIVFPVSEEMAGGGTASTIEVRDKLEITDRFKTAVLLPYLRKMYESLAARSKRVQSGIPAYVFVEVGMRLWT